MRDDLTHERLGVWHLASILGCQLKQVNESRRIEANRGMSILSPQNENVRFEQSRNVRFHGWLGVHGDGAYRLEPARTGATEGAARDKARAFEAAGGSTAAEIDRPSAPLGDDGGREKGTYRP